MESRGRRDPAQRPLCWQADLRDWVLGVQRPVKSQQRVADPLPEPPDEPGTQILQASNGDRVVRRWYRTPEGQMRFREHRCPDALVHFYEPTGPGEPIPLYAGQFQHSSDAERGTYVGGAALYWYPNPHIVASGTRPLVDPPKAPDLTGGSGWEVVPSLVIPAAASSVPVPPAEMFDDPFATDEPAQKIRFDIQQETGPRTDLDRVTFLIPNGWGVWSRYGICDPARPEVYWYGRLVASAGEWRVTIDARTASTEKFVEALQQTGQSAATHVGQVERVDGGPFSVEDAEPVLNVLRLALRVAVGRYVSLLLPVGWRGDVATWTRWQSGRVGAVRNSNAGFLDVSVGHAQLEELIERFLAYGTTEHRRDVLTRAVGHYLASTRDAEAEYRIGAAISGLELIAHHVHHEEQQDVSKTQWKKKNTEARIGYLLDAAHIPTTVPTAFTNLAKAAASSINQQTGQPRDALGTVVQIRNDGTHPETVMGLDGLQWWEAGAWANEMLLLAILRAVGYVGQYRSVITGSGWAGDTSTVPWIFGPQRA